MPPDSVVSIIRTVVPVVVGSAITWLAARGVDIDGQAVASAVTTIATAVYYGIVRAAESRWPRAGWLLGVARAPRYSEPEGG